MSIRYEPDADHVVIITIDRPEARNSADFEHFRLLRAAWERYATDDDARVAIITGVGDSFFTGADLKTFIPKLGEHWTGIRAGTVTEIDGYRVDDSYHAVLRHVPMWKPIIAAVNGYCTAGGMEMLGGTDIRLACPEARFAVMEPKRGLIAGGGTTVRLPRQIPWPQAMEFLLCADLIPAGRALAMGLLNEVVPRDELLDRAREYARQIVANSPRAVQATKRSALHGLYIDDDAIARIRSAATELHELVDAAARADTTSGQVLRAAADILHVLSTGLRTASQQEDELADWVMQGEDAIEGPRAFAERRPPDWQPA